MALDQAKNFAKVTVSTGYDDTATSIALESGHGSKLPTEPFNVVWWNSTDYPDPSDDPNVEIVRVTAISTDTLTVTRAQESTSASTKNAGGKTYKMIAGLTAAGANDILTSGDLTAAAIRALGFFDATNDGSGSGLDADKLDGQEGSYYGARIPITESSAGGTIQMDSASYDLYHFAPAATSITFSAPTGYTSNRKLLVRIIASGGNRTLSFSTLTFGFRASTNLPFPTSVVDGTTTYLGFIYNSVAQKWDLVAKLEGF